MSMRPTMRKPGYGRNNQRLKPMTARRPYLIPELVSVKPQVSGAPGECWVASVENPKDPAEVWTLSLRKDPHGFYFASLACGPRRQGLGVHRGLESAYRQMTAYILNRTPVCLDPSSYAITVTLFRTFKNADSEVRRAFIQELTYHPLSDAAWADRLDLPQDTDVREVYKHALKSLPR